MRIFYFFYIYLHNTLFTLVINIWRVLRVKFFVFLIHILKKSYTTTFENAGLENTGLFSIISSNILLKHMLKDKTDMQYILNVCFLTLNLHLEFCPISQRFPRWSAYITSEAHLLNTYRGYSIVPITQHSRQNLACQSHFPSFKPWKQHN